MADPDAQMVAAVLAASDQPMTTDLLLSAARAYEALRSSREREQRRVARFVPSDAVVDWPRPVEDVHLPEETP